ncbi:haloacid dehalogenase [Paenibacillus lautus]|nr:haloacid dehalogenase [Paenibacillus lautus]
MNDPHNRRLIISSYRELGEHELTGNLRNDVASFLQKHQCPKTAEHVLKVGAEARRIAVLYGAEPTAAEYAGYLHDISAVFPNHVRIQVAHEIGLEVLPEEEQFPMIIHQKISAYMAEDLFKITEPEILNAVGCHTTLRSKATLLDKALFVADKMEWDQTGIPPYLKEITEQLQISLDHAAFEYIQYLWNRRELLKVIHPWLRDAYDELRDSLNHNLGNPK